MGVLSTACEASLDHVCNSAADGTTRATVPSRAECRHDDSSDAASSVTISTPLKDPIQRLKEHASFSVAYKEAMDKKNSTATEKLALEQQLVNIKQQEISAREKEVKELHFHSMYLDLREDLKLAMELNMQEDIQRIKSEMQAVKKRRLNLYSDEENKNK